MVKQKGKLLKLNRWIELNLNQFMRWNPQILLLQEPSLFPDKNRPFSPFSSSAHQRISLSAMTIYHPAAQIQESQLGNQTPRQDYSAFLDLCAAGGESLSWVTGKTDPPGSPSRGGEEQNQSWSAWFCCKSLHCSCRCKCWQTAGSLPGGCSETRSPGFFFGR